MESFKNAVLSVAHEKVTVRENGRTVKLPMSKVIVKSIMACAAKGQIGAQRLAQDLISSAEADNKRQHDAFLEAMIEHKTHWAKVIEDCEKQGKEPPDIFPHPDHIIIDYVNEDAWINGPISREHSDNIEKGLQKRRDLIKALEGDKAYYETHPEDSEFARSDIAVTEKMIKILDDALPPWAFDDG